MALSVVAAASVWPGPSGAQTFDPARLMADVWTYYGLGVHRTGHEGDIRTSAWLAQRFRALGLETDEHSFRIRQFFLAEASIEDGVGRIAAFPIWLPRATPTEGLRARLVSVGRDTPDADIPGRPSGRRSTPRPSRPGPRRSSSRRRTGVAAGSSSRRTPSGASWTSSAPCRR
jgi:hypothetical protein